MENAGRVAARSRHHPGRDQAHRRNEGKAKSRRVRKDRNHNAHPIKKGAAPRRAPFSPATTTAGTIYDLSTTSLFSTLKAPGTWLARMPAMFLSIVLATVP